jgi:hypothetical protein
MEKFDLVEGMEDVFKDFEKNEVLFTLGHSYVSSTTGTYLGLRDADGALITAAEISSWICDGSGEEIGLFFPGACRSWSLVTGLPAHKIRVAVGFKNSEAAGAISGFQKTFWTSLLNGKTVSQAISDAVSVTPSIGAAEVCTQFKPGFGGGSKLSDIIAP